MFCPKCGAQITEGGKFCMGCGHRLEPPKTDGSAFFFAPPSLTEEQLPQPAQPTVETHRSAPAVPEVPRYVPAAKPAQPRPASQTVRPPMPAAVPQKKKKKKWVLPLILILILLLLIAGGAAAALLLMGEKADPAPEEPERIFLLTSLKTQDNQTGLHCVEELSYDDDGTFLAFFTKQEDGNEFGYMTERSIRYEYDDGLLETVVIEAKGETYEVTLRYDDGVLESLSGSIPEGELTGSCDRNGNVTKIEVRDEAGEIVRSAVYSYDDGALEEKVETVGNYVYTFRYQDGKETDILLENGGEEVYHYEYVYNDRGYLTEERYHNNGELIYAVVYECEYEDDRLSELVIILQDREGETELNCELEWDDEELTVILSGRDTAGERIGDDTYLQLRYDGDGNLINAVVVVDDEVREEYTYTYLEIENPDEYVSVDPYEPQWLIRVG